jgi:hypothetical protein
VFREVLWWARSRAVMIDKEKYVWGGQRGTGSCDEFVMVEINTLILVSRYD